MFSDSASQTQLMFCALKFPMSNIFPLTEARSETEEHVKTQTMYLICISKEWWRHSAALYKWTCQFWKVILLNNTEARALHWVLEVKKNWSVKAKYKQATQVIAIAICSILQSVSQWNYMSSMWTLMCFKDNSSTSNPPYSCKMSNFIQFSVM